ncbi:MAG TPA: SMI1/KNR4 family protein [Polyangiaceae bacterium]|jgi:hypothetical protein|nr:SMI1/KNR4 family protein [Polyangiaceae bacterium]
MDDNDLLRLLRARAESGTPNRPTAATTVADFERAAGLHLPTFYVRLLTEVANGGFGPGFGIVGIPPDGFVDEDLGGNLLEAYLQRRDCEEAAWRLPPGLLPLCNWGCGTFSYIDTRSIGAAVFTEDVLQERIEYIETAVTLAAWLSDWIAGVNLEEKMYETTGYRDGINPFTGKPMQLPIRRLLGRRFDLSARS